MKKIELVYREILYGVLEQKNSTFTQLALAQKLHLSLSTVHHALKPLKQMGAIEIKLKNFLVLDPEKILLHWASIRNITNDIVYQTRVEKPVKVIESEMPAGVIWGAYSAYKYKWNEVPADYSEIYVYGEEKEIISRFPPHRGRANLFILKKDEFLKDYGTITTLAHTFVDLWNLPEWYAKEFLLALKKIIMERL